MHKYKDLLCVVVPCLLRMRCNSNCAALVFIGASVYIMCVGVDANMSLKNAILSPILVVKSVKNRRNLRFLMVILLGVSLFDGFFIKITSFDDTFCKFLGEFLFWFWGYGVCCAVCVNICVDNLVF